jgi:hypothetical protein
MVGSDDISRPSAAFASRTPRLGRYPTQPHRPGADLESFIKTKKNWIKPKQDGKTYVIDIRESPFPRLQGLKNALGETLYKTSFKQNNEPFLKDMMEQAMPGKTFEFIKEPEPYKGVSAYPKTTANGGKAMMARRPARAKPAATGDGGEVKAVLAALVVKDDIYYPGTPMSEVPSPAKKWLREFMEKKGPAFLAKHAHVGKVRKGAGWSYHLTPKRGKTQLDVASAIDSVQNEKGPPPPAFGYAGAEYSIWLAPSAP